MKSFFSPGKVILSGEHSVVYGQPALVMSLPLGITVQLTNEGEPLTPHTEAILNGFKEGSGKKLEGFSFQIKSTLPQNSGLGSSAALAYALLQAAATYEGLKFSKEQYFDLVQKCEVFAHGKPSGIDASAVVFQGILSFQKKGSGLVRNQLKVNNLPSFVLIQSGKASETTREMVELASKHSEKSEISAKIGKITSKLQALVETRDFDPKLLTQNERLLEKWGVVGKKAVIIISMIEEIGGHAKIAGAGGVLEGSGIILAFHSEMKKLLDLCGKENWEVVFGKELHD